MEARELSPDDPRLKAVRRELEKDADGAPKRVEGLEAPVPVSPREAAEAAIDRILGSLLRDRDSLATLIATLRTTHGVAVAHMSDEEIAREARVLYTDLIRESTSRAFRQQNRENELKIKLDGY